MAESPPETRTRRVERWALSAFYTARQMLYCPASPARGSARVCSPRHHACARPITVCCRASRAHAHTHAWTRMCARARTYTHTRTHTRARTRRVHRAPAGYAMHAHGQAQARPCVAAAASLRVHPCHICTGTGFTPAPSAPGLGPPLPRALSRALSLAVPACCAHHAALTHRYSEYSEMVLGVLTLELAAATFVHDIHRRTCGE